jgi:biopolymer transport protein ExbD
MGMDLNAGKGGPNPTINVTPLVDVVLVLLIIFMVVTPMLVRTLDVRIPASPENMPPPPEDAPPSLVLEVGPDGTVTFDDQQVPMNQLRGRIEHALAERTEKQVFVKVDDGARYGDAVAAMDAARGAGAETIGTVVGGQ